MNPPMGLAPDTDRRQPSPSRGQNTRSAPGKDLNADVSWRRIGFEFSSITKTFSVYHNASLSLGFL